MNTLVSIIIPCYNQGHFILDALDSIDVKLIDYPVEIIIVNDGSTDQLTIHKLNSLSANNKYLVINQQNSGVSTARNVGIAASNGKYILTLDADNKITPAYINKAVAILEKEDYEIVYGMPIFFGEKRKSRIYKPQAFDIYSLLEGNFIDACAIYSKVVWSKNGGYDHLMPINGYEDWEFWINAVDNGFKFYFLNQEVFYYRVVSNSMMDSFSKEKLLQVHKYLINKHPDIFLHHFLKLCYIKRKYDVDINRWLVAPFVYILYKLRLKKRPDEKATEIFKHYNAKQANISV